MSTEFITERELNDLPVNTVVRDSENAHYRKLDSNHWIWLEGDEIHESSELAFYRNRFHVTEPEPADDPEVWDELLTLAEVVELLSKHDEWTIQRMLTYLNDRFE